MAEYLIRRGAGTAPRNWNDAAWARAGLAEVDKFHPRSSEHHPSVTASALDDNEALYVRFHVSDRFVRCVHVGYQQPVCRDSCVEFFVKPKPDKGYFNFELSCGGSMLLWYVTDHRIVDGRFAKSEEVPPELGQAVHVVHSMPQRVDPEQPGPVDWDIQFTVPNSLLEHYVGQLGGPRGRQWTGNFYKCGDETSHPHWGMWSAVGETLNFHQPERFGTFRFEA